MKLPVSVPLSTYLAYKQNKEVESQRNLKSENFDWDINHPKLLSCLCVEKLSDIWTGM